MTNAATNKVSFMCNCGEEIIVDVIPDRENEVTCPKCGQDYRFFGQSVLRFGGTSEQADR